MPRTRKRTRLGFLAHHSLSIGAILLLICWLVGYRFLDPKTHLGAFFGNAIADWSGSVVIILGTKFLYEIGSAESRPLKGAHERWRWLAIVHRHSLLLFLFVTGIGWTLLFLKMDTESKWGQVVGNLVSEWVQMAGLVFLTKRLVEIGSKESR
jgi:membrane protease YdiL (CAAX protease family)